MSFYTQSILQNCITILILLESVVQYETKRVTVVPHEEYVLDKPDLEAIKEEPTPRCRFISHSHNSHRHHNHHQAEEHLSIVTDAPEIDKWHSSAKVDQPSSNEAGSSFWMNNELSDDDNEANHNQANHDDQQEHHDSFYNLINHKFWAPDTADWDRHRKQHEKQLDDNWKAWMKVVSFFPSGQNQLSKQTPLRNHDNDLDRSTVTSTATSSLSRPVQPQKVLVKQTIPVQVDRKQEDTIKEPTPTGAVSSTKEDTSELEQQDPVRMLEPVTMHYDELPVVNNPSSNERETQQERPEVTTNNRSVFEDSGWDVSSSTSLPSASERVRNSLLKAADVARHLNQRALNATTTTTTRAPQVSLFNPENRRPSAYDLNGNTGRSFDSSREIWSADELVTSPISSNSSNNNGLAMEEDQLRPIFLGFGQVQRNDPFNGNMRTQARLSCQFGDATGRNLTISNVEWARFKGNYDLDKVTPDFDCKTTSCRVESVRTDVSTTVHPRPAIQNYIDTLIPSYSVTLHDVSEDQLGVYRCSALRQLEGRKELVYRIIQFE